MTTITINPAASNHDASQDGSGVVTLTGEVKATAGTHWIGLLLPGVTVPVGATINSATLYYKPYSTTRDDPALNWYGEAADNAAAFTTTSSSISSRSRTTAVTGDTATGIGTGSYRSVNITAQVEEVTSRSGWASGNNIGLIGDAAAAADIWINSYDTGANVWYVEIDYTAGRFTRTVAASGDDGAESTGGSVNLSTTTMDTDSVGDIMGFMFRGVQIPDGATVTTAYLKVYTNDSGRDSPNVTIKAQYAPAAFGTGSTNFSSRTMTTANVSWVATDIGIGAYKNSPSLTSVLQEVVDNGGWTGAGDVAFFLIQNSSSGWLRVASWDHASDPPAQLYVEWSEGAASQDIAPAGLAVGVDEGAPAVWNHQIVAAVGTGNDDGREASDGTVTLTNSVGLVNSASPITAYVLRDLNLPTSNIVITAAYARLYVYDTNYDSPGVTIRGQAAPGSLAATSNNLSSRTKTTAGVTWSAANIGTGSKDSPDIRTVVQEAVDDAGFDGDLAIFLIDNGTGGAIDFHLYEASGDNQPQLLITWAWSGIAPEGKSVAVGKGTPVVGRGAVSVAPAGKSVAVGKGTPVVGRGAVSVAPAGKSVAVGIGAAALSRRIAPAGRAVGLALGAATVGRGAVSVAPAGRAVGLALGAPSVAVGAQTVAPAGKSVAVGKGAATVGRGAVSVAPAGRAVGVGIGAATVARVALQIAPAGRAVQIGTGTPAVAVEGPQGIAPAGQAVGLALGAAAVGLRGIGLNAVTTWASDASGESWSFQHAGGGVNRMALVIVHAMRTTVGAFAATASYGGQAMGLLASQVYPDSPRTRTYGVFIFGLVAPPVGEQVVGVATGAPVTAVVIGALTLANVSQSTPAGAPGGANVVASTAAQAVVAGALAGSWLVGAATMRGGDLTFAPGLGGTEVYELASGADLTADITATGGYRKLAAAGGAAWAAVANALDYGVAAAVEIRQALVVYASGLGVGARPGGASVSVAAIRPLGLGVGATAGAPVVVGAGKLIAPAGLAAALALGEAALEIGGVVVAPAGLAAGAALGAAVVGQVVAPAGLAVGAALGAAGIVGSAAEMLPAGLAVGAAGGAVRAWSHRLVVAVVEDGYETPAGAVALHTTSLNVEAGQPWAALASGPLDVPNAATVVDVRVEMQTIGYDDPALEAGVALDALPAALAATTNNISGRTLAGPRAVWQASNVGQGVVTSPNLSAPAQAVVNLPEWGPGSRLLFVLRDLGVGGWLRWYSADAGAAYRPRVIVAWQFGAADLELAPAGLAVAAAAGAPAVGVGAVAIAAVGPAVGVGAGTAVVAGGATGIAVEGLGVGAAAGTVVVAGGLLVVGPEGAAVDVAAGTSAVGLRIAPAGLGLGAFGVAVVGRGVVAVAVEGLAVDVGEGAPAVVVGGLAVLPAGWAVAVGKGAPAVGRGAVGIVVAGRPVGVSAGGLAVGRGGAELAVAGLAVGVDEGAPAVGRGAVSVVVGGKTVVVALGAPALGQVARPAGVAVDVGEGAPAVGQRVAAGGRAVAVASGSAAVAITGQYARPAGLGAGAAFGLAMVALVWQPWALTLRRRGNGLTVDERGNGLRVRPRGNELTVEER